MLDYRSWIDRAVERINAMPSLPGQFTISGAVQPPLDDAAVDRLAERCRLPIPESLRRFWTTGAAGADLCYHWSEIPPQFDRQVQIASGDRFDDCLWGGLEILSADEVVNSTLDALSWAEDMSPEYPKDARLWEHSLPLVSVGNGDYVGLYVRDDETDPPVVYLCHEASGGSVVLNSNLDGFLESWEQPGYIGIDFLITFYDFDVHRLALDRHAVRLEALQALLRGEVRADLAPPPLVASEHDWLAARDSGRMLEWLEQQGLLNERKLRLYCCACCQRVADQMSDFGRCAVEVSRRYADGQAAEKELASTVAEGLRERAAISRVERKRIGRQESLTRHAAFAALQAHSWVSSEITQHFDEPECTTEEAAHAELVRHIFGKPFRPSTRHSDFNETIKRLAKRLYEGQTVASELCAALQDAGEGELADHFRSSDHPRGCWALDQILGK